MATKNPYFPNLEGELARAGISKAEFAAVIGTSERTANKKLSGKSVLTWPEADKIQKSLFPDKEKDYLFSRTA